MPWERKFDEDEVLEKAMRAFWRHGYGGSSMKTLGDCMGLNPGSIYAAFGDKKTLFHRALAHYEDQVGGALRAFERSHTPRGAILAIIDHLVADARGQGDGCGCFLINSTLEIDPDDAETSDAVLAALSSFEKFLQRLIVAGQADGEINPQLDAAKTARLLHGLIAGVRVLTRGNPDHPILGDMREQVENILG